MLSLFLLASLIATIVVALTGHLIGALLVGLGGYIIGEVWYYIEKRGDEKLYEDLKDFDTIYPDIEI